MDIGRATQRECDHPARDRRVAHSIDEDEAAHFAIVGIRIERDRTIERDVAEADLVEIEMLGGNMLERADVDFVLQLGHLSAD